MEEGQGHHSVFNVSVVRHNCRNACVSYNLLQLHFWSVHDDMQYCMTVLYTMSCILISFLVLDFIWSRGLRLCSLFRYRRKTKKMSWRVFEKLLLLRFATQTVHWVYILLVEYNCLASKFCELSSTQRMTSIGRRTGLLPMYMMWRHLQFVFMHNLCSCIFQLSKIMFLD